MQFCSTNVHRVVADLWQQKVALQGRSCHGVGAVQLWAVSAPHLSQDRDPCCLWLRLGICCACMALSNNYQSHPGTEACLLWIP